MSTLAGNINNTHTLSVHILIVIRNPYYSIIFQHAECVKYDLEDPYRGEYLCPHCWTLNEPVASGATLIVSPSSICYQWIEEIKKHVRRKNVKMLFYEGTKQAGYIQPRTLAGYDIVITT